MVRGLPTARTSVPFVTQCAETTHTAWGRGSRLVSPASVSVKRFRSMAFIGDPCPTKRTGIFIGGSFLVRILLDDPAPVRNVFVRQSIESIVVSVQLAPDSGKRASL